MNSSEIKTSFTPSLIALVLYTLHMVLNFAEMPALKFFYFFEVIVFIALAFRYKWQDLVIPSLIFFLIEGQGRILTNYNIIFKTIFDLYLSIILLKSSIRHKKIIHFNKAPALINILVLLHFSWYLIQFFNFQSVGFLGVLFATKIYIFPILLFYMFLGENFDLNKLNAKSFFLSILYILTLQVALVFYQKAGGEASITSINPYYKKIIGDKFTGILFRPFGTSFISGGISVYLAYLTTLLFFFARPIRFSSILKVLFIIAAVFACFTMQVRTSLLQLIVITYLVALVQTYFSKWRFYLFPLILAIPMSFPFLLTQSEQLNKVFPELELTYSVHRLQALSDLQQATRNRASFGHFYKTLVTKLERTPLGLGPGRTGAANSPFVNVIKNDLEFGMGYSWTLDNLFISLAIDFGWGMIFYSLLIITLPIYLLWQQLIYVVKRKEINMISASCSIAAFIILLSNWGAIAIPYNPVSFCFWFFASNAIIQLKADQEKHATLQANK